MSKALAFVPNASDTVGVIVKIWVEEIWPNPDQPRKTFDEVDLHALRIAMRTEGQLMPIFVRPAKSKRALDAGIKYEIIDGERRWRAASLDGSGITQLNAIVVDCDDSQQFLLACAMNFNREGHTPYEQIHMAYQLVRVEGHTANYVANTIGQPVQWVSQRALAYERLGRRAMEALQKNLLPVTVAITLSKFTHDQQAVQLNNYLNGGSVGALQVAVQRAASEGKVQGIVRKVDTRDHQRYLANTASVIENRLARLDSVGPEELERVALRLSADERIELKHSLNKSAVRLQELIKALEVK